VSVARTGRTCDRITAIWLPAPLPPRLRMEATGFRHDLLDGGWWPRSTDPAAELPGLVLAIDRLHAPVTRLVLSASGWDKCPRYLGVAGRVVRLGYFTSQPGAVLTALCDDGDRVDLLVVPPDTPSNTADVAMILAASTSKVAHAEHILSWNVHRYQQDPPPAVLDRDSADATPHTAVLTRRGERKRPSWPTSRSARSTRRNRARP
jgi:Family of unknown function (DUF5994)